jgi:tetratricopeptide (TPR) repeat protein
MLLDVADVGILISLGAFGTAVYGIFERGRAANRAERLRLTSIIESLAETRSKLVELVANGETSGNRVEVLHAQQELLSQQAVSLIRKYELTITSAECRELAFNLEEIGFREDAEAIWQLAQETAPAEGKTQLLFASRGYAWYLFRSQRQEEAREIVQEVLSKYPGENDNERLMRAETLEVWAGWEIGFQDPDAAIVASIRNEINELATSCVTPRIRAVAMRCASNVNAIQRAAQASGGHTAEESS